jgi:hypothetical protein
MLLLLITIHETVESPKEQKHNLDKYIPST